MWAGGERGRAGRGGVPAGLGEVGGRTVLSQPALSQTQPCFAIGSEVLVGNFILYHWADADCDSEMTTRDNQGVLRVVLGQPPISQTGPCPYVGSLVTVP